MRIRRHFKYDYRAGSQQCVQQGSALVCDTQCRSLAAFSRTKSMFCVGIIIWQAFIHVFFFSVCDSEQDRRLLRRQQHGARAHQHLDGRMMFISTRIDNSCHGRGRGRCLCIGSAWRCERCTSRRRRSIAPTSASAASPLAAFAVRKVGDRLFVSQRHNRFVVGDRIVMFIVTFLDLFFSACPTGQTCDQSNGGVCGAPIVEVTVHLSL